MIVFLTSCANTNNNLNIFVNLPKNIVKIENKHAIFLSPVSFKINKEIRSEDCESWQLNYNIKKLFNDSYKKILNSMFDDVGFIDKKVSKNEVENNKYTSLINFEKNVLFLEFYTIRNTAKLKISLTSNFVVEGNNKKIKDGGLATNKYKIDIIDDVEISASKSNGFGIDSFHCIEITLSR